MRCDPGPEPVARPCPTHSRVPGCRRRAGPGLPTQGRHGHRPGLSIGPELAHADAGLGPRPDPLRCGGVLRA
eukprot:8526223-Alexandrium_andersonii.AAC.1